VCGIVVSKRVAAMPCSVDLDHATHKALAAQHLHDVQLSPDFEGLEEVCQIVKATPDLVLVRRRTWRAIATSGEGADRFTEAASCQTVPGRSLCLHRLS